eukprot:334516_1
MDNKTVMNNVETIALNGDCKHDIDIDEFMAQNWIQTNNITTVHFHNFFSEDDDPFDSNTFHKLLTKFPNTKYLQLVGVYVNFNVNAIKNLYPKLKGLEINGGIWGMDRELIQTYGKNLDNISFNQYDTQ